MKTERARLKINVLPLQRIVIGVNWAKGASTDNNTFPKVWLPYLIIDQDVKIWSSRSYARHWSSKGPVWFQQSWWPIDFFYDSDKR